MAVAAKRFEPEARPIVRRVVSSSETVKGVGGCSGWSQLEPFRLVDVLPVSVPVGVDVVSVWEGVTVGRCVAVTRHPADDMGEACRWVVVMFTGPNCDVTAFAMVARPDRPRREMSAEQCEAEATGWAKWAAIHGTFPHNAYQHQVPGMPNHWFGSWLQGLA